MPFVAANWKKNDRSVVGFLVDTRPDARQQPNLALHSKEHSESLNKFIEIDLKLFFFLFLFLFLFKGS